MRSEDRGSRTYRHHHLGCGAGYRLPGICPVQSAPLLVIGKPKRVILPAMVIGLEEP
jgi:hypothetical protein